MGDRPQEICFSFFPLSASTKTFSRSEIRKRLFFKRVVVALVIMVIVSIPIKVTGYPDRVKFNLK